MQISQGLERHVDVFALKSADLTELKPDLVGKGRSIIAGNSLPGFEIDLVGNNDA